MNALNPSIILQGRGMDLVGSIDRGATAGQRSREMQERNALNALISERGGDIMRGNPDALNALAAHGTQGLNAAYTVQNQRQGMAQTDLAMDATRQGMDHANANQARLGREETLRVEQFAAKMSAEQRQAEAAKIENAVKMGMAAQSPEQWDQVVGQSAPDLVGRFADREMIAAQYMSVADVLKGQSQSGPAWRQATAEEATSYGAQAGQINQETGQFKPFNPPSGMSITSDGKGGFSMQQGVGVTGGNGKSLTDGEGKSTGFLIRAKDAQRVLNQFEQQGTNFGARVLGAVPGGLGNFGQSSEFQQFDQAKRDLVNAILRRESGAVISEQEFDNADKQYFPQPGDGPDVIAQKRQNRDNAIKGLEVSAGDGVNRMGEQNIPQIDFSGVDASSLLEMDLSAMSAADLTAYMARMDELGM